MIDGQRVMEIISVTEEAVKIVDAAYPQIADPKRDKSMFTHRVQLFQQVVDMLDEQKSSEDLDPVLEDIQIIKDKFNLLVDRIEALEENDEPKPKRVTKPKKELLEF